MNKKYFTVQQANKRLPLVKKIVADILIKGNELKQISVSPQGSESQKEYEKTLVAINGLVDELESLGCFYKDWNFEKGLVDFPCIIDGREVMLCWRSDEADIRWYHGSEDGYQGRSMIPEDLLGASENICSTNSQE